MSRVGRLMQLDDTTWHTIEYQEVPGRILTVLFAYGILVWNRFGLLTFTSPKAPARLFLIGIYSWLALAAIVWIASRQQVRWRDAAIATAIAHVPLVGLAFFMAIVVGFARINGPGVIFAIFVVGMWMPAILARTFRDLVGWHPPKALLAAIGLQTLWILGPGLFLLSQLGLSLIHI